MIKIYPLSGCFLHPHPQLLWHSRSLVAFPSLLQLLQSSILLKNFYFSMHMNHMQFDLNYLRFLQKLCYRREDHHKLCRLVQKLTHLFDSVQKPQEVSVIVQSLVLLMCGPPRVAIFIY